MFGILRTLLAFNVVLLHIFGVSTLGNYSVSFFFLLSGFLMTLITQETYGFTRQGFSVFWINRILRLYPIYLVVILLTIASLYFFPHVIRHPDLYMPTKFTDWIYNITMIFPKIVPHNVEPRLVPPSWALTNELLFYLLISLGISKTKLRTFIWLILSILYYIGTYMFYDIPTYRYAAIFASSLPFALGASIYWLNKYKSIKKVSPFSVVFLYLLFVLNALFGGDFGNIMTQCSLYLNMVLAYLLIYLLFNMEVNWKIKKIDTYFGYYSYPIYLSHYLVAIIYTGVIGFGVLEGSFKMKNIALVPYTLFLLLFCMLIVHLIDVKIDAYKKKLKIKRLKID